MNKNIPCKLILVLDLETKDEVFSILDSIGDSIEWVKIGLQLYLRYGGSLVEAIASRGYSYFSRLEIT